MLTNTGVDAIGWKPDCANRNIKQLASHFQGHWNGTVGRYFVVVITD